MSGADDEVRYLAIGGARFEPESGDLTGPDGRGARLAPQPARLLALLTVELGRVVTRETIAEALWPHGAVEIDQGIGYAMREIRKALESVGADPAVIETIPRRGFRLRAEEPVKDRATALPVAPSTSAASGGEPPRGSRTWIAIAAGLGVAVLVLLTARPRTEPPVVAIFAHQPGDDATTGELAGTLGAALTTRLTQDLEGRAGVIGPVGTASLSGPEDTDGARDLLGACLVLSGGLRMSDDATLVVFTQLVRSTDRVHVWASTDTVPGVAALEQVLPAIVEGVEQAIRDCRD
jgi:DNA-binding winged helix-turn-helix (wHTH) protein